jgi:hypothetical protein
MTDVIRLGCELTDLVVAGRPDGLPAHRAATAAAEEVGECIGAHNKIADGRVEGTEHFRLEWAQAMLMLVMLGRQHLDEAAMAEALDAEMRRQRGRWSASRN